MPINLTASSSRHRQQFNEEKRITSSSELHPSTYRHFRDRKLSSCLQVGKTGSLTDSDGSVLNITTHCATFQQSQSLRENKGGLSQKWASPGVTSNSHGERSRTLDWKLLLKKWKSIKKASSWGHPGRAAENQETMCAVLKRNVI